MNLSLHVLGKRADGYHELDSRMFAVSVYDELRLRVKPSRTTSISCVVSGPEKVPGGEGNLAARAAAAVLERLGTTAKVEIRLRKVIPFGAGLGGGSSDAATVIRVLPGMLGRRLARADAHAIAEALGADVPFFLECRPARATGKGEQLTLNQRVPKGALVIAIPPDRVDTAWAYRNALKHLTSGQANSRKPASPRNIDAVEAWFFNDFQRGVEERVASVRRTREALEALGARATVLSGSGSSVVGWFPDESAARDAAAAWNGPGKAFAAKVIRRAPRPVPATS